MAEHESSRITSRPPLVDFAREDASVPAVLYVDRDDRLYVRSWNNVATQGYIIRGDLLHADGVIRPFELRHSPTGAGADSFQVFNLAEGYLLAASVQPTIGTTQHGQSFVELGILRGRPDAGQQQKVLLAGYLEALRVLSYPPTRIEHFGEGRGQLRLLTTADPAAGAEMSQTVPTNEIWRVDMVRITLVTSAAAANRSPRLEFVQGGVVVWRSRAHDPQTASLTRTYNWARGGVYVQALILDEHQNVLPDTLLIMDNIIRTATDGIQGGDDYGGANMGIEVWVREF